MLDVGCGKGELAYDLAERARRRRRGSTAIAGSLAFARARFRSDRLQLVEADATEWVADEPFDTIVLSNVLEHIERRPEFLRRLAETARPTRAPDPRARCSSASGSSACAASSGVPYFSDPTHETEYSREQLEAELAAAGFRLVELEQRWGELWAAAEAER